MDSNRPERPPVEIISDDPGVDTIGLGYSSFARTLSGLIANKNNATPMVIAVHGPCGSGKTTLMQAIRSRLERRGRNATPGYRHCKTVWFPSWKYDQQAPIQAVFIETVLKAMAADGFFGLAKSKVEAITRRIDKSKIFASVSQLISGVDVSEFFAELENKEKLGFYDTFQVFFDDLVWTFLNWRFKLTGEEKPDDRNAALVIFIDELDRCSPGHIVHVLETIKRFMGRCGFVFVIGADRAIIDAALAKCLPRQEARGFWEKIVQMAFTLPPIDPEQFDSLIDSDKAGMAVLKAQLPLLMPALGHNPRRLKRFINNLNLFYGLLQDSNVNIDIDKVVIWRVIEIVFCEFCGALKENPGHLSLLQKHIQGLATTAPDSSLAELTASDFEKKNVPSELHLYLQQPELAELAKKLEITPEELRVLQKLSAAVGD